MPPRVRTLESGSGRCVRRGGLLGAVWAFACGLLLVLTDVAGADDFWSDPTLGGKLHLTYRVNYSAGLYRGDGTDRDQDIDQYLSIRTHDLFTPGVDSGFYQGIDTDVSVRHFKDIGGTSVTDESLGLFDTFDGGEDFQLRTLNARVRLFEEHLEITAGRQYIEAAEWVHIDGGKFRLRGLVGPFGRPIEIIGFGGQRVAFYPSIHEEDIFGNDVWGGTVIYTPARDTRLEISDVHYVDNSLRVMVKQRFAEAVTLQAIYRQINEDPESVVVDAAWERSDWNLDLRGTAFTKLGSDADDFNFDSTFSDRVPERDRDHDRRFNIGDLDPFTEVTLEVRKGLSDEHGVFGGVTGHWIHDRSDRDVYNTDWYEVWGGIDTLHVPWEGLTGRLTVRSLYTDLPRRRPRDPADPLFIADTVGDGEPNFLGVEMLFEQDFARRIAAGTSVEWRMYDYESRHADISNLHSLSVTAYGRWRPIRVLTFYAAYVYERDYRFINDGLEDVHGFRVQASVSW